MNVITDTPRPRHPRRHRHHAPGARTAATQPLLRFDARVDLGSAELIRSFRGW